MNSPKHITVFTDGSCIKTKNDILCGYGIYFPNKELENVSKPFNLLPKTNQRAELYAIYEALTTISENIKYDRIFVYSDSEYSIKSLTIWVNTWEKNGWKTANNKPVLNQDIIIPLYNIIKNQKDKIIFVHVKAHTGNQDFVSISNDFADKLAKNGAKQ
jgi:Ribonuclease HI